MVPGAPAALLRARLLVYAAVQFVVLTAVAMVLYPGGAMLDRGSDHYLFFRNFLSDLGATRTYSGRPNTASQALFAFALGSVGLALIAFSTTWRTIARRGEAVRAGRLAERLSLLCGVAVIGIAATPRDRVLGAHDAFVWLAFAFLLAYVVALTWLQLRNGWPRMLLLLGLGYVVVLVAYPAVLAFGPDLETASGVELHVAAQKVVVYSAILYLGLQAATLARTAPVPSPLRAGS